VPAEEIIDTPMDFDSLRELKSGLGTAAVIVMDKSTDMIKRHRGCPTSTSTRAAASARRAGRDRLDVACAGHAWSKASAQARNRHAVSM
jgi:hypothetical protein